MRNNILTIIIPVYNVEDYIYDCLVSLHNQTNQNFSTIFVDDCGHDTSMKIIESFLDSGGIGNARIIKRSSNGGLSAARNTGLKEAKSDYVVFLDSDDYLDKKAVDLFIKSVERFHSDVLLFDDVKVPSNKRRSNRLRTKEIKDASLVKTEYFGNRILTTAWNKVVKRSFIEEKHIYFQEGIIHEDILWGWKLFQNAQSVVQVNEITLYYRERENSIMTTSFGQNNIESLISILFFMKKDMQTLNNKLARNYFYSKSLEFLLKIFKYSSQSEYTSAYERIKMIIKGVDSCSLVAVLVKTILYSPECFSFLIMDFLLKTKFRYIR